MLTGRNLNNDKKINKFNKFQCDMHIWQALILELRNIKKNTISQVNNLVNELKKI